MDSSSADQHFSHHIASEDKFAVCHEDSKIPSSFVLIDLHLLTQYMTPPPTWPPPRQRKLIIKGENPNKSANIDNRSYMKEPFVSSVSCRYTGSTVQAEGLGYWLLDETTSLITLIMYFHSLVFPFVFSKKLRLSRVSKIIL